MDSTQYPIILPADPEHRGLRFAVPLILILSFWLTYLLVSALLRRAFPEWGSVVFLSCLGALPISLLVAGVGESVLKRVWPSGREVIVRPDSVILRRPDRPDKRVELDDHLFQLWWAFPLGDYPRGGRERRVSGDHWCVAGQLQQNGERLVCFCFVPRATAQTWSHDYDLRELNPEEVYDTSFRARLGAPVRPELPSDVIAGDSGRHWLAERNRWEEGVELGASDFEILLQVVHSPADL